ncbi:MAG: hypothetical protein M1608_11110 [Candidatus Omnitrophica bacterium]|nr:hypothetical protein [Candidatus Omnitrophota bacterium]
MKGGFCAPRIGLALAMAVLCAQAAGDRGEAQSSSPKCIYTYDARPLRRLDLRESANAKRVWDAMHLLAALEGLANRNRPQFYLFYCGDFGVDTDQFWFDWLRGEDGWLRDAEVHPLKDWTDALEQFRPCFNGLVVYDPNVPATSNLGSTAAGCENLLPVRFDPDPASVYTLLTRKLGLPVKLWLVHPDGSPKFTGRGLIPDLDEPASGSAKIDAYRWAIRRYLGTGQCAPGYAAYYIDAFWLKHPQSGPNDLHTLSNHDYFIAHKAFFFDLSSWGDELPNDDPQQPLGLDRKALLEVLRALYDRAGGGMTRIGGFTPWPFKYTDHPGVGGRHGGVPTEWEFSRTVSQFNACVEADAAGLSAMANASFFQHYPLASRYPQPNAPPALAAWKTRGWVDAHGKVTNRLFVGHYVGDYDSPAWLYKAVPAFFRGPTRGPIPLGWAFDPNLADRAAPAMVYAYRHATTNDYFIAGDSGAGYLNPRALTVRPDSGLPSGLSAWVAFCRPYYSKWDITITGFVLDGAGGASTELEYSAYKTFSPNGLGTHCEPRPAMRSGVATCPERDLPDAPDRAAEVIARACATHQNGPGFLWARSILKAPGWYAEVAEKLRAQYPEAQVEFVDPYTFFGLIKLCEEQSHTTTER